MYAKVEIMSIRFVAAFLNADMDQHKGLHESTPWIFHLKKVMHVVKTFIRITSSSSHVEFNLAQNFDLNWICLMYQRLWIVQEFSGGRKRD